MPNDGSFAGYPVSVNETRAERAGDASLWSPREALIAVLRDIDAGVKVDVLIVAYREVGESGGKVTRFAGACPDAATAVGTLAIAQNKILRGT